jgi:hypothetical protein
MEQLFMVFCRQHRRFSHEPDSRFVKLRGDESELFRASVKAQPGLGYLFCQPAKAMRLTRFGALTIGFRGVSAGILMAQPV